VELWHARWAPVPVYPGTSIVIANEPVSVSLLGVAAPFWEFTTGITRSADMVTLRTNAIVNTGVQAFYAFTITYDVVHGDIGLT
jgi:hypothetical protein